MFLGTYEPKLDAKGRLILPARFRDQLANGLVLTRGQERCLYAFSLAEFEDLYERMRKAPLSSEEARSYQRLLLSGAQDQIPDKQGRVTIAPSLREYANLDKDLAVVGVGSRVEIWNLSDWQEYVSAHEEGYSALSQQVEAGFPGLL